MEIIKIGKNSLLYPEINSMVIIFAALCISINYKNNGTEIKPGEYATIECLSLNKCVCLPVYGPVEAVIDNKKPDLIEITVMDFCKPSQRIVEFEFIETSKYLISPFFITFYERCYDTAKKKFGVNYSSWPDSWRMAWVVRNSLSHNGCIYYKDLKTPSVTWKGISISPSDQDKPLLYKYYSIGDLVILMIDMEKDLA
jgi:hypothetical protein